MKRYTTFLSAVTGNILEYYDFTVYAVFSVVIGKMFFPESSELISTLYSLGVFALGFLTRPIGGIFFGYIGDSFGRRIALIISMLGMTVSTFAIGLIPTFHDIGYAAPILLIFFRLLQGLCISGEGAGAAIFLLEHFHNFRAGFVTGIVQTANILGTFFASLIGILINYYFPDSLFAWRFAFILGGIMGISGYYLRLSVSETPVFKMLSNDNKTSRSPFFDVVKNSWKFMIITFAVGASASSVVYLVKTYVNVFYKTILHFENIYSLQLLLYTSFVLIIAMPAFGALTDRIGTVKMVRYSSVAAIFFIIPILYLMSLDNLILQILGLTGLATIAGAVSGAAYIFCISLFSAKERFSGVAFSYNFGVALFGGTSPVISTWLVKQTGYYISPAIYIISLMLFLMSSIYFFYNDIYERMNQEKTLIFKK